MTDASVPDPWALAEHGLNPELQRAQEIGQRWACRGLLTVEQAINEAYTYVCAGFTADEIEQGMNLSIQGWSAYDITSLCVAYRPGTMERRG